MDAPSATSPPVASGGGNPDDDKESNFGLTIDIEQFDLAMQYVQE
jgi:hypothetical protein